jgi:hypothetical protein
MHVNGLSTRPQNAAEVAMSYEANEKAKLALTRPMQGGAQKSRWRQWI